MFYQNLYSGYVLNDLPNKAIDIFNEIRYPDEVIITILYSACAQLGTKASLELVKKVSLEIPKSFHSNPRLLTSLLDALMKCGDVEYAELLFMKSTNKVSPMYGVMMNGFNKDNNPFKALNLFSQMKKDGFEGDIVIYLRVIKSLSQIGDCSICQSFVKQLPDSFRVNNHIENALIDMWVSRKTFSFLIFFNLKKK
jgi:pentatricopeptide repeat protein